MNYINLGGFELEKLKEISSLLPEVKESEVPEESDFRKVEVIGKETFIFLNPVFK